MEQRPCTKGYGVSDHFLRTYQVTKVGWLNCVDVSDVIHIDADTWYSNCGLREKICDFWLITVCFMIKKDHFERTLLL